MKNDLSLDAPTKASPTASRRGHFLSLNSDPFNSSFGVVDTSDEMWYTNGTKYDVRNPCITPPPE